MRKKITFSLLLTIVIYFTFVNNTNNVSNAKTWNSCGNCHMGSANTTVDSVILMHPTTGAIMTGFYPDSTYKIRMVGSNTSGVSTFPNFGFQLRVINTSSTIVGTFQTPLPTNTGLSSNFLTQNAKLSPTGTKYIVEANWKAPTGTNVISLQSVLNAVDNDNSSSGDEYSSSVKTESYNVLGIISTLGCANRRFIGNLTSGTPASGVSFKVPYTGGNGGAHFGQTIASTGVTGLTATLTAGNFVSGADSLTYTITGTAASAGTASFALNIGLKTCAVTVPVTAPVGAITSLDCTNGRLIGVLTNGQAASGVSFKVPYTGGNSGTHSGQVIASTGVTGLTATLASGSFVNGSDSVTYTISGTPSAVGNASFALNIGGRNCIYDAPVNAVVGVISTLNCAGGKTTGTLMNGTTASGVSFKIPYTGGNGGAHTGQITSSTGVTGLTATLSSGNFVAGADSIMYSVSGTPGGTGNATFALNIGGKTCNFTINVNPPVGVITTLDCGTGTTNGTLSNGVAANGVSFTIPYTGGNGGTYEIDTISSTGVTGLKAIIQAGLFASGNGNLTYSLSGIPSGAGVANFTVTRGGQTCVYSINVNAGLIAAIDCNSGTTSGTLIAGATSSGVSFSIPYSGGNGGLHTGQTVQSTSVTGLTAIYSADSFVTGAGSMLYNVTGAPSGVGNATFAINIGGKTCTYVIPVTPGSIAALNCGSGSTAGSLIAMTPASGVTFTIPYTGGNAGLYNSVSITSTGVTGLTATTGAGNFNLGSGTLTFSISGTPSTFGSADFFITIGGKSCLYSLSVSPAVGAITTLLCQNSTTVGVLYAITPANGVSFTIPYTGGNNGSHSGQVVASTGVTGLTATLDAGLFNNGNGNLTYNVSGTPSGAGVASFALNIGGKTCTYTVNIRLQTGTISTLDCGGIRTIGTLKGSQAASGVSFKVPYTGGNGGTYTAISGVNSTGVTGLSAMTPADTFVVGSDSIAFTVNGTPSTGGVASFTFTIDGKSCTHTIPVDLPNAVVSSLTCQSTNSTGTLIRTEVANGVSFTIPYTGGNRGVYTSQSITSTGVSGLTASLVGDTLENGNGSLTYTVSGTPATVGTATFRVSIGGRTCDLPLTVIQPVGTVGLLKCDSIKLNFTEEFMALIPLAGVSLEVPYSSSNGGSYGAISINSAGVTGLVASANAGVFNIGDGKINLSVTGTPSGPGLATFNIVLGGKTCSYAVSIKPLLEGSINSLSCMDGKTTGVLIEGTTTNGTFFSIPYDGGNRGYHFGQTVASRGVTGLTARLNSGQFAIGFGMVSYTITGTPSAEGIASFDLNIGGKQCTYDIPVRSSIGQVMNISCDKGNVSESIFKGTLNSGIFFTIPYQGGNGGPLPAQSVLSTNVSGLTAQTPSSVLNFGDGVIRYDLSGTTTTDGLANFNIIIGNQNCVYGIYVYPSSSSIIGANDIFSLYKSNQTIYVKNHREDLPYNISDLSGKSIATGIIKRTETSLDLISMNLPNGIYILKLNGDMHKQSLKFTIE